jgi:hypothetical protein
MTPSPEFRRFADLLLASVPSLAAEACDRAHAQLQSASLANAAAGDRAHTMTVLQATRPGARGLPAGFSAALREQLRDELARTFADTARRAAPDTEPSLDSLTLVDDQQIEEDIEVARVIQLIDTAAEADLRELRSLCATLRGATEVSPELHPMRPEVCARALVRALHAFDWVRPARLLALRIVGKCLAERLEGLYRDQLRELRRWGVQPLPYRLRTIDEAPSGGAPSHDDAAMRRLAALAGGSSPQQAAAQLVPRLLVQVADQAGLAPALRTLLARLAVPAMRGGGDSVLSSFEHPMWRLVDRITTLGSLRGGRGGADTLAGLLQPVVARLERAGEPTAQAYQFALQELDAVATGWADSQLADAGLAVDESAATAGSSLPTDWGGEGSLPTVPMPLPDSAEAVHRQWLDGLREGDWLRLFLQARWTTAQVSGRSSAHLVLAERGGATLQSVSQRALLRLREQGLATSIDDHSRPVRRAVDTLTLDLGPPD